jgi:transaldolase/glucose-6-phosphate isomerase
LVLDDIARAAEVLQPVFERTKGADGYISLEVSPKLAHDMAGTIAEAKRLFAALGKPNVMIKVPATPEGIPAIQTLIGSGLNINVTLVFSLASYEAVVEAYLTGLEKLVASGGDPSRVASVASFFVSRVDTLVDSLLDKKGLGPASARGTHGGEPLYGKAAIANAKLAYARFHALFSGPRWEKLAARGARKQRPLWASTSTKNPIYPDTLYADGLIGPDTVDTVPPATLQAILDHGAITMTLDPTDVDEPRALLGRLAEVGINMDAVTQQLLDEGVESFAKSFETLMASIGDRRKHLLADRQQVSGQLGAYQAAVDAALAEMARDKIVARIWAGDHTVWKPDPAEISNRLGWLRIAEVVSDQLHQIEVLVEGVRADGYTHALLLGMGGSSLAPEVFSKTFGDAAGHLALNVLDSTDPGAVLAYAKSLDPRRSLYIVSTKSGGTVETFSFFRYFYNQTLGELGADEVGKHFIAITDPGSALADVAAKFKFRATFLNDPNIGGRYSALSYFGVAPAALVGVDVRKLLDRATRAAATCGASAQGADNPGAWLGAVLGELAKARRDKVTFILPPALASFGDWIEQLIAESTGKEGKGILPVAGETSAAPDVYANDRLFVHFQMVDEPASDKQVDALAEAGHPIVHVSVRDTYDVGAQFFLWEFATAVAGYRLGINPFDQPNVESAKILARDMVAAYHQEGKLPEGKSELPSADSLKQFLATGDAGNGSSRSYVTLQAYIQPTPENSAALHELRTAIQHMTRMATTSGYGPRFLHSTGQLHKGDAGNGLFIQFVDTMPNDAPIPDEAGKPDSSMTFGILKTAQVLGDAQALLNNHRRIIRFDLGADAPGALRQLAAALR